MIRKIEGVLKEIKDAFMRPILEGTDMVPIEFYENGKLIDRKLVKVDRNVLTKVISSAP